MSEKLSQITSGGAIAPSTDQLVSVRSGTTDLLVTPGQAAAKSVSDNTKSSVASVNGATTATHVAQFADTSGTVQDGGVLGTAAAQAASSVTGTVAAVSGGTTATHAAVFTNSAGTIQDAGFAPVSTATTVNGHALSGNVVVSASDITTGTLPVAQAPVATSVAKGVVQPDNSTITISGGVISTAGAFTAGTWAARPGSPTTDQLYFATDLGTGVMVIWTGAKWKPLAGRAVIAATGVGVTTTSASETNLAAIKVPVGLASLNTQFRLVVTWNTSAYTTGNMSVIIRGSTTAGDTTVGGILNSTAPQNVTTFYEEMNLTGLNSLANHYRMVWYTDGLGSPAGLHADSYGVGGGPNFGVDIYFNLNALSSAGQAVGFYSYSLEWIEP